MIIENFGEIVILLCVFEVIIGIVVIKVDGVYLLCNKVVMDSFSKKFLGRGVYFKNEEDDIVVVDIYVYL